MRVSLFLTASLALAFAELTAQPLSQSRVVDMLATADRQLALGRPYNALEWYKNAYDEERSDTLALAIAELNFDLRDYRNAANYYKRALRRAADGAHPEALYRLGLSHKAQGDYGEAIEALRELTQSNPGHPLTERADLEIAGAQMALELTEPPRIKVTNLGRTVNTTNQEYSPALSGTGDLYYAGYGKNGLLKLAGGTPTLEVYRAPGSEDGGFDRGRPLGTAVNTPGAHTSNVAVSLAGTEMLLVRSRLDGRAELDADIYYATGDGDGDGWTEATPVDAVNGDYRSKHPAFGQLYGERVMFFASDRPGGEGGMDLYYAPALGDGRFGAPVNLGPEINTAYDDVTPHYREGTLYWSTDGRPSLGGFDVYRAEWAGDAWTAPEHMGKGFNSSLDDRYFALDVSGKRGVLASNRAPTRSVKSKTCCDDVFLLDVEPIVVDLLTSVLDGEGQVMTGVTLQLATLHDGDTTVISTKVNPRGNRFDFGLVDGETYLVTGQREGYTDGVAELTTVGVTEPDSLSQTLVMTAEVPPVASAEETVELTRNQPIRLANIYYDFDDDRILAAAEGDLDYVLTLMRDYPEMVVELGSHTDARGRDDYNEDLSQRRAESAKAYIVARGIDAARIRARGYGEDRILNECVNGVRCTDDEHRFNRRTEFTILEGPKTIEVRKLTRTRAVPDRGSLPAPASAADTTPVTPAPPVELPSGSGDGAHVPPSAEEAAALAAASRNGVVLDNMSSLYYEADVTGVPRLAFGERRIDFGVVEKGEQRRRRFAFRNVGDVPATIGIVSACECTTLDWTRGEIPPGGEGFVDAVFDSSDKDAGELIGIDIVLDQEAPSGNGIIERVQYEYAFPGEE